MQAVNVRVPDETMARILNTYTATTSIIRTNATKEARFRQLLHKNPRSVGQTPDLSLSSAISIHAAMRDSRCAFTLVLFRNPTNRLISAFYYCYTSSQDPLCGSPLPNWFERSAYPLRMALHWGGFLFRELLAHPLLTGLVRGGNLAASDSVTTSVGTFKPEMSGYPSDFQEPVSGFRREAESGASGAENGSIASSDNNDRKRQGSPQQERRRLRKLGKHLHPVEWEAFRSELRGGDLVGSEAAAQNLVTVLGALNGVRARPTAAAAAAAEAAAVEQPPTTTRAQRPVSADDGNDDSYQTTEEGGSSAGEVIHLRIVPVVIERCVSLAALEIACIALRAISI